MPDTCLSACTLVWWWQPRHEPSVAPAGGTPCAAAVRDRPLPGARRRAARRGQSYKGLEAWEVERLLPEHHFTLGGVAKGRNMFITSSAGTGKSYLLGLIMRMLRALKKVIAITASTGIAAVHVRGTTLHSYAGVKIAAEPEQELAKEVMRDQRKVDKWQEADVLVIDEISMISDDLFNKVDYVGRKCRGSNQPFGGLQVIVMGEFFQLPPVSKPHQGRAPQDFCFKSPRWASCDFLVVVLVKMFRQEDAEFVNLLNEVRRGDVSSKTVAMLKKCLQPVEDDTLVDDSTPAGNNDMPPNDSMPADDSDTPADDSILPTMLYPRRKSADKENKKHFCKLPDKTVAFDCQDGGNLLSYRSWLKDVQAPPKLELKIGTQVMLVTNLGFEAGLVNDSRGIVTGYVSTATLEREHGANLGFDTGREGTLDPRQKR
eukprot:jgi/Mesen1/4998/ME000248S04272